MRTASLALALLASACVRSSSVTCDDGTVCREGTACFAVDDHFVCVGDDEIVCGNGRVEDGEACDDGNTRVGDGCSPDCLSDETCGNHIVDPVVLFEGPNGPMLVGNEQCDDGNLVSHDGCSSSCLPETAQWVRREALPAARFDTAMATEDNSRRIVMFGGRDGDRAMHMNDTWEWTHGGWSQIKIALSPVPRSGHAMASDGARTVMFGGTTGNDTLGDTWILTGRTWTPAGGPNPPARTDHAMAYMPDVGIVMFGGQSLGGNDSTSAPVVYGDTWVFDSAGWRRLSLPQEPPARMRHVMAYDPVLDRIILSGGQSDLGMESSTWEFDGTQWTHRVGSATPPIYDAAIAFDRVRRHLIMHGGASRTIQQMAAPNEHEVKTTYQWTGSAWEVVDTDDVPGALFGESASTDPITGEALLFGGATGLGQDSCGIATECIVPVDKTWLWNGIDWLDSGLAALPPLASHTGTIDPDRHRVVVFGGVSGAPGANIYELDDSWRVIPPKGQAPSVRTDAAIAHVSFPSMHTNLLFGGKAGAEWVDDTWSFDGAMWSAVATATKPPGRSNHSMAFDASRNRLVLFGGQDSMGLRRDVWEFDGTDWTQIEFLPSDVIPEPRKNAAMAYDPVNENIVLFGGDRGSFVDGRTWTWDGAVWTRHDSELTPPPRRGAGMAWDAVRQRIVLFGGGETLGNDAWEWDGQAWSFVSIFDPPPARSGAILVSAPGGDGVLAIGGIDELMFPLADVLQLSYLSSASTYEACRADLDDDGDGTSGCEDPDCATSCFSCGDGVCDAPREDCGICSDCTCDPQCGNLVCDPGEDATSCPGDC